MMQTPMAYHYRFSHPAVAADYETSGIEWLESAILFDANFDQRVTFTRNEPTRIMFRFNQAQ